MPLSGFVHHIDVILSVNTLPGQTGLKLGNRPAVIFNLFQRTGLSRPGSLGRLAGSRPFEDEVAVFSVS
jgi:hypothetical protein